jgi:hypothetical protein
MVSSEAIAEIDRLVEQHLSVAKALQIARAHLANDSLAIITPFAEGGALALAPLSGNSLVPHTSSREARINALNGVEFFNMKYNDAVAQALQVWGSEQPRPRRADILTILTKGGFAHPNGEAGTRSSIRNAAASGKNGGPVIKLPDGDPDGEYALREWFGSRVSVRPVKRKPSQQKETTLDLFPDEQTEPDTQTASDA